MTSERKCAQCDHRWLPVDDDLGLETMTVTRYITDKAMKNLEEGKFSVFKMALNPEYRCDNQIKITFSSWKK